MTPNQTQTISEKLLKFNLQISQMQNILLAKFDKIWLHSASIALLGLKFIVSIGFSRNNHYLKKKSLSRITFNLNQ